MTTKTLQHGTHLLIVQSSDNGMLEQINHRYDGSDHIDDSWVKRGRRCPADSVIQAHINAGWQEVNQA